MSRDRGRIAVVLRVRRIQEQLAAAEVARAQQAAMAAEHELLRLREQYVEQRPMDAVEAELPVALDIRDARIRHAEAIVRGRSSLRDALTVVDERRAELTERSMAVKGLERLDERVAEEHQVAERRDEVRVADEHAGAAALRDGGGDA